MKSQVNINPIVVDVIEKRTNEHLTSAKQVFELRELYRFNLCDKMDRSLTTNLTETDNQYITECVFQLFQRLIEISEENKSELRIILHERKGILPHIENEVIFIPGEKDCDLISAFSMKLNKSILQENVGNRKLPMQYSLIENNIEIEWEFGEKKIFHYEPALNSLDGDDKVEMKKYKVWSGKNK